MKEKLKSRKFWITVGANLLAGYFASRGNLEAAAIVAGVATGSYNIGQGMVDAKAKDLDVEAIKTAVFGD